MGIIRFRVTRRDSGAAVQGARIEVEKAERAEVTNAQGEADIITYWAGNFSYSVSAPGFEVVRGTVDNRDMPYMLFSVSLLYAAGSSQPPSNGINLGDIGTSCKFNQFGMAGQIFFEVRHPSQGRIHQGASADSVRNAGLADPRCWEQPETKQEGLASTQDLLKERQERQAEDGSIWEKVGDIVTASTQEAQAWRAALNGIWSQLEAWLIERIVGILLKGLDREVEEMKRHGRT